jgi:hypothetical protein
MLLFQSLLRVLQIGFIERQSPSSDNLRFDRHVKFVHYFFCKLADNLQSLNFFENDLGLAAAINDDAIAIH